MGAILTYIIIVFMLCFLCACMCSVLNTLEEITRFLEELDKR